MYSMERFAIPGTVAFHLVNPGMFIGNLARLSKGDCQGLAAQYGCSASFCVDGACNRGIKSSNAKISSDFFNFFQYFSKIIRYMAYLSEC